MCPLAHSLGARSRFKLRRPAGEGFTQRPPKIPLKFAFLVSKSFVCKNLLIIPAYDLKEASQQFYRSGLTSSPSELATTWRNGCVQPLRSRLEPFKKRVRMLRGHLDGF
jgi:hypothetical protein